jgi:hypothetical protein
MTVHNVTAHYVSPFDDRVRMPEPLAPRVPDIAGRTIGLLDISKNRGEAFLDQVESHMNAAGARTIRWTKEIFSKPAALSLIDEIAARADLVVEALAD